FFAPLLAGQFLYYALAAPRRPGRMRAWLALHGRLAAACLPWAAVVRSQLAQPYTSLLAQVLDLRGIGALAGTLFFDPAFLGLALERGVSALGLALLLALGLGLAAAWKTARSRTLCLCVIGAGLGLMFLVEKASGHALNQARYFVFLSPYFYILAADLAGRPGLWAGLLRGALACVVLAGTAAYACQGLWLDPRLPALARAVRQSCDPKQVVLHMGPYYYPSLRYYYLPEYSHRLPCPDPKILSWDALPGYPAALAPAELSGMDRCAFIDPGRTWRGTVLGAAPCAEIAAAACP
ncbi:MAG: hypothetical protein PHU21_05165, partial [Elusimicrobia bacterium]|nr:hypothetical protein [Elusimicrobiota bacterium]